MACPPRRTPRPTRRAGAWEEAPETTVSMARDLRVSVSPHVGFLQTRDGTRGSKSTKKSRRSCGSAFLGGGARRGHWRRGWEWEGSTRWACSPSRPAPGAHALTRRRRLGRRALPRAPCFCGVPRGGPSSRPPRVQFPRLSAPCDLASVEPPAGDPGQGQASSLLTDSLLFQRKGETTIKRREEGAGTRCFLSRI